MMTRVSLLLLSALAMVAALPGCGDKSEGNSAEVTQAPYVLQLECCAVRREPVRATLDLVGTLIPIRATTVVSDVDGVIESFPLSTRTLEFESGGADQVVPLGLDIGHEVESGDVLVQIDPVEFQLALDAANAELELARRNLQDLKAWKRTEEIRQARGAFEEASARHERAKADLDRARQLHAKRALAQEALDEAVMDARTAAAALTRAEAALELAEAGPTPEQLAVAEARVRTAEAQVAIRQDRLDKTTLRAPYPGMIVNRYVDVGDRVTAMPRVEILQLIDPRVLFAEVDVPEKYQGVIKLDEIATVTAAGITGDLPARIDLINAMIDPETRTFRIRVTIDNRQQILKAGGFVHVQVPIQTRQEVTTVPVSAVSFADGQTAVFVLRDGVARKTPVELGISDSQLYEVVSGVSEGELVVTEKIAVLDDGLAVQPKQLPADATQQAEVVR
jgi:multidrug efflux pump subunit AcrA (membrane-fusion protein)